MGEAISFVSGSCKLGQTAKENAYLHYHSGSQAEPLQRLRWLGSARSVGFSRWTRSSGAKQDVLARTTIGGRGGARGPLLDAASFRFGLLATDVSPIQEQVWVGSVLDA
jgi:hypothetical protein